MSHAVIDHQSDEWVRARRRVIERRRLNSHVMAFVVVNAVLTLVWAVTGARYFWPAWMLGLWGIGLALHGLEVFMSRSVPDEDIQTELGSSSRVVDG